MRPPFCSLVDILGDDTLRPVECQGEPFQASVAGPAGRRLTDADPVGCTNVIQTRAATPRSRLLARVASSPGDP